MDGGTTYELLRLADILQFNNNYLQGLTLKLHQSFERLFRSWTTYNRPNAGQDGFLQRLVYAP